MMYSLLLDELEPDRRERLRLFLGQTCRPGLLPGAYWWPVPQRALSPLQREHLASCGPYCLALLLEERPPALKMELLVRAENNLHCSCLAMVNQEQRELVFAFWDRLNAWLTDGKEKAGAGGNG
ncbi:MAG: hypothetical protein LBJ14_06945 [Desulfarculales bacterium]|jgi:hypothetical protein|nr:hypothetical protein [Desulfarculales bacterium]